MTHLLNLAPELEIISEEIPCGADQRLSNLKIQQKIIIEVTSMAWKSINKKTSKNTNSKKILFFLFEWEDFLFADHATIQSYWI